MLAVTTRHALILCSLVTLLSVGAAAQASAPVWTKADQFWYRRTVPGGYVWLNVDARHGVKEPLFDHQRLAIELTIRTGVDYTPLTLPFAEPAAQFVVKYDGSNAYIQQGAMAIEFVHGGHHWRCDLQIKRDWNRVPPTDYECLSRRPVTKETAGAGSNNVGSGERHLSPDRHWEAFVQNHNIAVQPVGTPVSSATLLTSDGSPTAAYQAGSIRWSSDSKALKKHDCQ